MARMNRNPRVVLALAVTIALASVLGGCADGGQASTTPPGSPGAAPTTPPEATPDLTPVPTPVATAAPTTDVPVTEPPPPPAGDGTTETPWGTILDAAPDDFPVMPGAAPADPDEPASGAWISDAGMDEVAAWYEGALAAAGYGVDLGSALEDGSRVLDARTDLPECRIQVAFRPAGESTMILVLYGAGCAAGG